MMHRLSLLLLVLIAGCNKAAPIAPPPSNSAAGVAAMETSPRNAAGGSAATPTGDVKLSIVTFEGIQERIARERGKVVVMDAWSTSCPPCMKASGWWHWQPYVAPWRGRWRAGWMTNRPCRRADNKAHGPFVICH